MPKKSMRPKIILSDNELENLKKIANSRTGELRKVVRAKIILMNQAGHIDKEIAEKLSINRHMVELCLNKCVAMGVDGALNDIARSGKKKIIDDESKAWVTYIACHKPLELGYSYELWTITLLLSYIHEHAAKAGHPVLKQLSRSKLWVILNENEMKPHKITYYMEKRDSQFEIKMCQLLYIYKEVELINQKMTNDDQYYPEKITISYDEKPGIQAIGVTVEDFRTIPGKYKTIQRDSEYIRYGTVSLLAGIDLHDGSITAIAKDSHKSSDFIEFLKKVNDKYAAELKIRIILDNHSSHISKETMAYLKTIPGRFEFVYTPKHGSWLNLIEGFFSKLARTALRGIRVSSKENLKERIMLSIDEINKVPVVYRWTYKMDEIEL